jgi:alkylation response protein AidB-like acyl-CoA dehydrogenase
MTYSEDQGRQFRKEVISFLAEHWSSGAGRDDLRAFRSAAIERGYLFRNVPKIYGGAGEEPDPLKAQIIREEFDRVGAPRQLPGGAVRQLLPTLLVAAAQWQKAYFIPPTLTAEFTWCQGYSEPAAGSDLASLQTKAVLEGDEWIINGQKVWTSDARTATHMYLLARTEPEKPKYDGMSYLLLDMRQPGVTVRPLKQITGESHFNEVFFDNARTPKDWIIGRRGEGWSVSRTTLDFERAVVGSTDATSALFDKLLRLARTATLRERPALEDPLVQEDLIRIFCLLEAQRAEQVEETRRTLAGESGSPASGAFAKLYSSMLAERMALAAQRMLGVHALGTASANAPGPTRWVNQFMNSIAAQIGGGTSNMQRNVIAEKHLGLPRDIRGQ